ncbi:hypothetical protein D3C87_2059730 [compost metagenome]
MNDAAIRAGDVIVLKTGAACRNGLMQGFGDIASVTFPDRSKIGFNRKSVTDFLWVQSENVGEVLIGAQKIGIDIPVENAGIVG